MLTTEEINILNALPDDLKDYAEAQMHQKVKDYSPGVLKNACVDIIVQFYKDTNTKNVNKQILEAQRDELINAFKGANKDLTIEEGRRAFKMGVSSEFGPFFGGCYVTYVKFLNGYRTKPERERSIRLFLDKIKPAKTTEKPLTIQEQTYKSKQSAIYFFNEYKNTKQIIFGGSKIYECLVSIGLINWTEEEKNEIQKPEIEKYRSEIEFSMKKRIIGPEEKKQILDNLTTNPTLLMRVKKIALKRYFDNLINSGKELKDMFKESGD